MAEKRSSRGFTRVDALVAGVTCLVLVLLVPALLARPRERSVRTLCAANLSQIGKAMLIYANDNEDTLPRAGGRNTAWGPVANWAAPNRVQAFNLIASTGEGGRATISSCFYLLVKYYEVSTRLFVCRGDKGTTEFKLTDVQQTAVLLPTFELIDAWDFGTAYKSCSYSYHLPFSLYALTTSRDPNLPVAADRNPWFKSPASDPSPWSHFKPDVPPFAGTAEQARAGNAIAHGLDGQNVLFLDGRVTFETRSFCGMDADNIYTVSSIADRGYPIGVQPKTVQVPSNRKDSFLVHDPGVLNDGSPPIRR